MRTTPRRTLVIVLGSLLLAAAGHAAGTTDEPGADPGTPEPLLALDDSIDGSVTRPLPPRYEIGPDGSVAVRICYNWSCSRREIVVFTAAEMAGVAKQIALCSDDTLQERLQRVRIGIWQMERLAAKRQPLLNNDEAINDKDADREGRTDCVDNASNTTTFLHVLDELGALPGWEIEAPEVRDLFTLQQVHWTAVAVDRSTGEAWSVDSWYRPHGHLPFVMPLSSWLSGRVGWLPPYAHYNPTPRYSNELCRSARRLTKNP